MPASVDASSGTLTSFVTMAVCADANAPRHQEPFEGNNVKTSETEQSESKSLDQRPSALVSQPAASVTWSQCSVNFPSFTRTVSNANAS
jgi:hypothetical protein